MLRISIPRRHLAAVVVCVCVWCATGVFALYPVPTAAHEGVTHRTKEEASTHILSLAQMEQLVRLLNTLVHLLEEQRTHKDTQVPMTSPVVAVSGVPLPSGPESTPHPDLSLEDTHSAAIATFSIEVEEHDGKTHVHARYVDKPEDMFFVDAPLNDEAALIQAITKHTGLPAMVVKPALVYFR